MRASHRPFLVFHFFGFCFSFQYSLRDVTPKFEARDERLEKGERETTTRDRFRIWASAGACDHGDAIRTNTTTRHYCHGGIDEEGQRQEEPAANKCDRGHDYSSNRITRGGEEEEEEEAKDSSYISS